MQLSLSKTSTNQEIAEIFEFIAQVLNLKAGNYFRSRSYEEAAEAIKHWDEELFQVFAQQDEAEFKKYLDDIPGVGESILKKIIELFKTGQIKAFQKYVQNLPGGILPLTQIHGIGGKRAFQLAEHFELTNPDTAVQNLLELAQAGKIRDLPGWGEKSEQDLIEDLKYQHRKSRIPYQQALEVAQQLTQQLKKAKSVKKVVFLGSLRRQVSTVGDIDLGAAATDPDQFKKFLEKLSSVDRVLVAGSNMLRVVLDNGWQVDIKLSPLEEWGSFIQHFTGSKDHNIKLREYALKKGYSLSEHGIKILRTTDNSTQPIKKFDSETDFYHFLGLKLIPPQERTGRNELERYQL